MPYGGHPGESLALRALAAEHGLLLLEDAAHALGTRIGGEHAGTLGLAGAYSFFSNKNLAVGEGGMVVCRDDETAASLKRLLRSHGMTTLSWERHRGHAPATTSSRSASTTGSTRRAARSGSAASRGSTTTTRSARRSTRRYRELLADVPGVEPALAPPPGATLAHHLFTVVLDARLSTATRCAPGSRAAGVQTSIHYPPVHRFEIYREGARDSR